MKKRSNLSRLLGYAGRRGVLTYLSWVLSAAGALLALVPFWYIWRILREVLLVAPQYERAVHITQYGWMAVLFAVAGVLVYIAGLMCSHLAPSALPPICALQCCGISQSCRLGAPSSSAAAGCAAR